MADDQGLDAEFLDRLYGVAMEPERFAEMAETWQRRLLDAFPDGGDRLDRKLANLDAHLIRAEKLLFVFSDSGKLLPLPLTERLRSEVQPTVAIDTDETVRGLNEPARILYGVEEGNALDTLPLEQDVIDLIRSELAKIRVGNHASSPRVVQTARSDTGSGLVLSLAAWSTAGGRALLLIKTADFSWPDKLTPIVRQAFGLTEAEAEIMQSLAEGPSVSEIAAIRNASVGTVRTQVRAIYAKTGARNQSDLLRLALGIASLDLQEADLVAGAIASGPQDDLPHPRPDERRLFTLPDGRTLDYAEFGDPDGDPVLFMHSDFFGDGWPAAGVHEARRRGLRIIAPARPCYAGSTAYPRGANTLDTVASDCAALLDHLRIDRAVVAAQTMAPSNFAIRFASLYPDRAAAMVFISLPFPFRGALNGRSRDMLRFHRFLSTLCYRSPRLLEFVCKVTMAFHTQIGSQRFFRNFAEGNPADIAATIDPAAFGAMVHGAAITAEMGHAGYHLDQRDMPGDIDSDFAALSMPVRMLIGDTLPMASSAYFREMMEQQKDGAPIWIAGGGQFVLFTHPEEVVKGIAAARDSARRLPRQNPKVADTAPPQRSSPVLPLTEPDT